MRNEIIFVVFACRAGFGIRILRWLQVWYLQLWSQESGHPVRASLGSSLSDILWSLCVADSNLPSRDFKVFWCSPQPQWFLITETFKLFWRKWSNGWNMGWLQMPRSSPILWPLGRCWLLQFTRWRWKIFQRRIIYKRIVSEGMRSLFIINIAINYDLTKSIFKFFEKRLKHLMKFFWLRDISNWTKLKPVGR